MNKNYYSLTDLGDGELGAPPPTLAKAVSSSSGDVLAPGEAKYTALTLSLTGEPVPTKAGLPS